jgi:predicted porin
VPVAAQVTVSGTIDTGVGALDKGGSAANGSYTGMVNNSFATSGITFSGSEDLGGGMKAVFTINKQFDVNDGEGSANAPGGGNGLQGSTTSNVGNFDVISVGVSGGFGEIRLGRQDMVGREAFGIGRFTGNFGRTSGFSTHGDEIANSVMFTSPTFAGVTVALGSGLATGAQSVNEKSVGGGVRFANGPLRVGLGYQKSDISAGVTGKNYSIAADYDLGMAKIGVIRLMEDDSDATVGETKATSLNVLIPIGSGLSLVAAYHTFDNSAAADSNDGKAAQVAVTKDLSKRTMVYAHYTKVTNEANARFSHRGVPTIAAVDGSDNSAMVIGLRHNF